MTNNVFGGTLNLAQSINQRNNSVQFWCQYVDCWTSWCMSDSVHCEWTV